MRYQQEKFKEGDKKREEIYSYLFDKGYEFDTNIAAYGKSAEKYANLLMGKGIEVQIGLIAFWDTGEEDSEKRSIFIKK